MEKNYKLKLDVAVESVNIFVEDERRHADHCWACLLVGEGTCGQNQGRPGGLCGQPGERCSGKTGIEHLQLDVDIPAASAP